MAAAPERASRVRQRQRLIDACISALHIHGPSRTTVEKVVALAGLFGRARALGIPLLTVCRPRLDYPQVAHDFAEVHARLAALAGA